MATTKPTRTSAVVDLIKPLLNPYEEFDLQAFVPGISGYVLSIRTNLMIHRKRTRRNIFIPHTVYQSTSLTALPNKPFLEAYLRNARKGAETFINKGEYLAEIRIGKEWTSIKRHYNQWIYYDRQRGILFGTVKQVERLVDSTDVRANNNAPSKLAQKGSYED